MRPWRSRALFLALFMMAILFPGSAEAGRFRLLLESRILRLNGTEISDNSQGTLLSKGSLGVSGFVRFNMGTRMGFRLGGSFHRLSFFEDPTRDFPESSVNLHSMWGGLIWRLGNRAAFELRSGRENQVFYHATSASNIHLDLVNSPFMGLGFGWILVGNPKWTMEATGEFKYTFGADASPYDTKGGYGMNIGYRIERRLNDNWRMGIKTEFSGHYQNTEVLKTNRWEFQNSLSFGRIF